MNNKKITVMLSYARSGGTLLNRCLSALPNVVILSEINPEATWISGLNKISNQSERWYNIKIEDTNFINQIKQVKEHCDENNKHLIIRDFSYGSFVPRSYNNFNPSYTLLLLNALKETDIEITVFAFVRDAIDIWLSMNESQKKFYDRELSGLHKFTQLLISNSIRVFRYEDFCSNPEKEMRRICEYIKIPYSEEFKNYYKVQNVTGDIRYPADSRSVNEKKIKLLKRRRVSKVIGREIEEKTMVFRINKLLDY